MRKILFIFSIISLLSFNNYEISYHAFDLYEKPDNSFINDSGENDNKDSLKHLDSTIYLLLEKKKNVRKIFNFLKSENRLLGIAVYTYKEKNKIFVESIMLEFKGINNSALDLGLYYKNPIEFENNKNYSKLSEKMKVEYILHLSNIDFEYSYSLYETKVLGFPVPVPDAKEIDNKWGDFEDFAPKR